MNLKRGCSAVFRTGSLEIIKQEVKLVERPEWMPETHLNKDELTNLMVCICYHKILECADPKASPEDKALLPGLMTAMVDLLML